jgi:superkiller protein 3
MWRFNHLILQGKKIFFIPLLLLLAFSLNVQAQIGGLDVFKSKNPTVKKKPTTISKPPKKTPKKSPKKLTPEEIEAKYEDALETGNIARDERRYADAEKAYRSGIAVKTKDFRAHYGLGNVFADQQRWEEAEKAYRDAYFNGTNNADINTALSFVLVQQKSGTNLAAKLVEAEKAARRAIQIEPNNPVAYDRLGVALEARGIYTDETEQSFRRSTELDPNFALAYAHLARIQARNGKRRDSERNFKRAIELAQDAPTITLIAEAYQADQRYAESEPLLMQVLRMDDKYPPALYLLGRAFAVSGRFDEAETVLKRCVAASPRTFDAHYMLGSVYQRMDKLDEAEGSYDRAAELANATNKKQLASNFGFVGVGDGFLKAGRTKDALRVYQKAQTLDPGNQEIKSKIARARSQN